MAFVLFVAQPRLAPSSDDHDQRLMGKKCWGKKMAAIFCPYIFCPYTPPFVRTVLWLFVLFVARKQVVRNRSFASHEKHEETRKRIAAPLSQMPTLAIQAEPMTPTNGQGSERNSRKYIWPLCYLSHSPGSPYRAMIMTRDLWAKKCWGKKMVFIFLPLHFSAPRVLGSETLYSLYTIADA